ncbi:hypothetical protein EI94DRAFT_1709536, partial [Lactarius quietus]
MAMGSVLDFALLLQLTLSTYVLVIPVWLNEGNHHAYKLCMPEVLSHIILNALQKEMTKMNNKPQDDHRERRKVEPIGFVVLAKLRLATNSKVKSEMYKVENACNADQTGESKGDLDSGRKYGDSKQVDNVAKLVGMTHAERIGMGNPGVFQSYLYPKKPIPVRVRVVC